MKRCFYCCTPAWRACLVFLTIILAVSAMVSPKPCVADDNQPVIDFTTFSLEELKNVEIISASKKPEKVSEVPSAVFVITQEDIQRSGSVSIADALRLAPGVQVARTDLVDWAISIRSLNENFSDNLLVMIDGRSVYTPVFSGVFWDVQDTVMEDIERIEVIRGPGAAVWGANAVNGVINIITKHAKETQGWQVTALGGTDQSGGSMRYGGSTGNRTCYRAYAKYFNQDRPAGSDNEYMHYFDDETGDNWRSVRGGFRIDRYPETALGSNSLTLQGEAYLNRYDAEFYRILVISPYHIKHSEISEAGGCHILGRWEHTISETSDTVLQFYYDHARKDYSPGTSRIDTADLDFRHRFALFSRHDIIWGLGYRFITDDYSAESNSFQISMNPEQLDQHIFSAFIQDKVHIVRDRLNLTLSSKFEHNDYTGFELQPSIRLLWTPGKKYALWGAVSRAVRVPSRIERGMNRIFQVVSPDNMSKTDDSEFPKPLIPGVPGIVRAWGNNRLNSEKLLAYEAGYRMYPTNNLRLDMTAFYNYYDELIAGILEDRYLETRPSQHYVFPLYYNNNMRGEAWGAEVAADWQIASQWRLKGSYAYLKTRLQYEKTNPGDKSNPSHQFSVRSSLDITEQLGFDVWLRYVDSLSENDVDRYATLDARIAWTPTENLELSLVGQNLFERHHGEFSLFEVERGGYFKLTWRF